MDLSSTLAAGKTRALLIFSSNSMALIRRASTAPIPTDLVKKKARSTQPGFDRNMLANQRMILEMVPYGAARMAAMEKLFEMPQVSEVLPSYWKALSDPDYMIRRRVAKALAMNEFYFPDG